MNNQNQHAARFHRPDVISEPLYVISVYFNPRRWRSRSKLYLNFQEYIIASGAHLLTVECSFGEREEIFKEIISDRHSILHVRVKDEFWIKENLANRAFQELPADWKYACLIDGDIVFARPDWVGETLQQLQHYKVVQMFSKAVDLNPGYEIQTQHTGFMWCYLNDHDVWQKFMSADYYYGGSGKQNKKYYKHPGFCWAWTREAFNAVGGMVDWSILGGGDMFMAYALVGALDERTMPRSLGETGIRWLYNWQERAEKHIRRNVGYVEGLLLHYWHGRKKDRRYNDRGQFLIDGEFNPERDLKRDSQGLYQLNPDNIKLRDGIRKYMGQRNEDSQDV